MKMQNFKFGFMALGLIVVSGMSSASFAMATCGACDSAIKMTKSFQALNFKNEADRSKGGLLAIEAAKALENFTKLPKSDPTRLKVFTSLLPLVREAGPYDGESQLAEVLAAEIKSDAKLKSAYADFMKSTSRAASTSSTPSTPSTGAINTASKADSSVGNTLSVCKTNRMQTSVDEALCRMDSGVKGQDPADSKMAAKAKSCIKPFNFEDCIK